MIWALLVVFWVLCVLMVVHVWRSRDIWPVCGSERATRVFWTASLAALPNPVTLLLYTIFGVGATRRWTRRGKPQPGRVACSVTVGLVVLCVVVAWWPARGIGYRTLTATAPEDLQPRGVAAHLQQTRSNTNHWTTWAGQTNIPVHAAAGAGIDIVLLNDGPLAKETARALAAKLLEDPVVPNVTIRRAGTEKGLPQELPLTTIQLGCGPEGGWWVPGLRYTSRSLSWQTGNGLSFYYGGRTPSPAATLHVDGSLSLEEYATGFATPSARYREAGRRHAGTIADSVLTRLRQQFEENVIVRQVPDDWMLPWEPLPEMEEIAAATPQLRLVQKGTSPLSSHLSVYTGEAMEDTEGWLEEWAGRLAELGWEETGTGSGNYTGRRFEKDGQEMFLGYRERDAPQPPQRRQTREPRAKIRTLAVQSRIPAPREWLDELAAQLASQEEPEPDLMIMMRRALGYRAARQALEERLATLRPRSLPHLYAVADSIGRQRAVTEQDRERAKELIALEGIMRVRAVARGGSARQPRIVEDLRKRTGLEEWEPDPLSDARLKEFGSISMLELKEPMEVIRPAGDSLMLHTPVETGQGHWLIHMLQAEWGATPGDTPEYTYMEVNVSAGPQPASFGWSHRGPQRFASHEGGGWQTRIYIYTIAHVEEAPHYLNVRLEELDSGQWKWTLEPEYGRQGQTAAASHVH